MRYQHQAYVYVKALCFVVLLGTLVFLNGCELATGGLKNHHIDTIGADGRVTHYIRDHSYATKQRCEYMRDNWIYSLTRCHRS